MYKENQLLPISAIQHIAFCRRRCALVFVERIWSDNLFTAEGTDLHTRIQEGNVDRSGDIIVARGLHLRSMRLGLTGIADVIEFRRAPGPGVLASDSPEWATSLPGYDGLWVPFPVEYKRGRIRREDGYQAQLCAQAICLEEMLGVTVMGGAVFYGGSRRRLSVEFDEALRTLTESLAGDLHHLIESGTTPRPEYQRKCRRCSLLSDCLPEGLSKRQSVERYLSRTIDTLMNCEVDGEATT